MKAQDTLRDKLGLVVSGAGVTAYAYHLAQHINELTPTPTRVYSDQKVLTATLKKDAEWMHFRYFRTNGTSTLSIVNGDGIQQHDVTNIMKKDSYLSHSFPNIILPVFGETRKHY